MLIVMEIGMPIFSGSLMMISISKHSTSADFLNRIALLSITGFEACAPMMLRPSTAVPFKITATRLLLAV